MSQQQPNPHFRFLPNSCNVCHKTSKDITLFRCSVCRTVYYCSQKCQKRDFPKHKTACKVLKELQNKNFQFNNTDDRKKRIATIIAHFEKVAERKIFPYESDIILFAPRCESCPFDFKPQSQQITKCDKCCIGSYCSDKEHKKKHEAVCDFYAINSEVQKMVTLHVMPMIWFPAPSEKRISLIEKTWSDYVKERNFPNFKPAVLSMFTNTLSIPVTIAYCLEKMGNVEKMDSLVVHMIGARLNFEIFGLQKYEEILHLIPGLKKMKVAFVGPEAPQNLFPMEVCEECKKRGASIEHICAATTYDKFVEKEKTKPDIAFMMHSELHKPEIFKQWENTLKYLIKEHIWTAFTTLKSEEIKDIVKIAKNLNANIVMQPQQNPFFGFLPRRDEYAEEARKFCHDNLHIFAIQGQAK